MTPDSDTYGHILLNGLLWYAVLFGIPTVRAILHARRQWKHFQAECQRDYLRIHGGLHPNVTVLPKQRSAR